MMSAETVEVEPLREAVRELAGVVSAQQLQLAALRDAIEAIDAVQVRVHHLARFDALRAGREPPNEIVVEVPAEDPYNWL